jgi:hypothetical protein
VREGDRNVTVLMHRVIITERMGLARPSERHFVDHENGDSLDNRRRNDRGVAQLRWLTPKENMATSAAFAAARSCRRSGPRCRIFRSKRSDLPDRFVQLQDQEGVFGQLLDRIAVRRFEPRVKGHRVGTHAVVPDLIRCRTAPVLCDDVALAGVIHGREAAKLD